MTPNTFKHKNAGASFTIKGLLHTNFSCLLVKEARNSWCMRYSLEIHALSVQCWGLLIGWPLRVSPLPLWCPCGGNLEKASGAPDGHAAPAIAHACWCPTLHMRGVAGLVDLSVPPQPMPACTRGTRCRRASPSCTEQSSEHVAFCMKSI